MDTPEEAARDVNLAEAMYEDHRKILDQDIEMSPEIQVFMENAMKLAAIKANRYMIQVEP